MKPWSEDDTSLACAMRECGKRIKVIALRLDRSPRAVAEKFRKLGVRKLPPRATVMDAALAQEVAAAKAERATAPLYRPRDNEWMR